MIEIPIRAGATPIDDISGLKINIATNAELDAAEAGNIALAVTKYLSKKPSKKVAPFDVEWSLKLHKEMYGEVWDWAGVLRKTQPNIGVPAYQIRPDLHSLFQDLKVWSESGMDLLEQAVRLHHRAVYIHPFSNGNGRWSRMLADIWLKKNAMQPVMWPSNMVQESSVRDEYIAAVKNGDNGNLDPLMEMFRRYA